MSPLIGSTTIGTILSRPPMFETRKITKTFNAVAKYMTP